MHGGRVVLSNRILQSKLDMAVEQMTKQMTDNLATRDWINPSYSTADALALVLLFYTINWTPEKKAEWLRITGVEEATTKVMCDHIRKVQEMENGI
jgi:hypothetical protein